MSTPTPPNNEGYEGLTKRKEDGTLALSLLIDGIYCAQCIQKIESALLDHPNVTHARLNFTTRRLSIEWSGQDALANIFAQTIQNLGYHVTPYSPQAEKLSQQKEKKDLLICLGIAGFAMGNIMLLSVGLWSTDSATMGEATRALLHWISALIALPAITYAGRPFFASALSALRNGQTNMDVPISLALILTSAMSLFEAATHGEHIYFDSACMLMFFLLIGRYCDLNGRLNARSAATELLKTLTGFATTIDPKTNSAKRILISDLKENMHIRIAAGETAPADGIITEGQSTIDTSLITGETLPRQATQGDHIYAGTINHSAPLTVKVTKQAQDTLLADIARLMEKAEQGNAKYVRLAARAAKLYTPLVHSLAAIAFILWACIIGAPWQDALLIAVTVLIITCPCALGLAVPVVQVLATSKLLKNGVLVKSADALERLAQIDSIAFDKTGTLTIGKPKLIGDYSPQSLKQAASLSAHSNHPLSQAISQHYNGALLKGENIQEHAGKGLEATLNGQTIKLGSRAWCGDTTTTDTDDTIELWLSTDDQEPQRFQFEDPAKQDASAVIKALKTQGLQITLISGDRTRPVQSIANQIGITSYHANQSPTDKHALLEAMQQKGHKTLMVGDGLNDAPTLASAHIAMAPGSAVDLAQNAADIIFMGDHLKPVSDTLTIAKSAQRLVKENLTLAAIYNIFAIPLAFAGIITPLIAALAMSGSSLLVIANAFRLKSPLSFQFEN